MRQVVLGKSKGDREIDICQAASFPGLETPVAVAVLG